MRKIISLMHISLDGFAAGPNGEMDWIILDEEMYTRDLTAIHNIDTAIYGRITYGMMEGYWPTLLDNPEAKQQEIDHANWIENVEKVVFSRSMEKVEWNNARLVRDNYAEEVRRLKQQPGSDIVIFGSPQLVNLFGQQDLVDEYRLNINPILLGKGIPMFPGVQSKLKLLESQSYDGGVISTRYAVVR